MHEDSQHRNRYDPGHAAETGGQDELLEDEDEEEEVVMPVE